MTRVLIALAVISAVVWALRARRGEEMTVESVLREAEAILAVPTEGS